MPSGGTCYHTPQPLRLLQTSAMPYPTLEAAMQDTTLRRVAIIGGARIPFCRSNTAYAQQSNQAMLTAALNALTDKYHLAGTTIDAVAAGAVLKHARDFN